MKINLKSNKWMINKGIAIDGGEEYWLFRRKRNREEARDMSFPTYLVDKATDSPSFEAVVSVVGIHFYGMELPAA